MINPHIVSIETLTEKELSKVVMPKQPHLARLLIDEYMNDQGDFDILSPRENEVLRLYTSGRTLSQIALELKVSKSSVVVYLKRVGAKFRKLLKPIESEL